MFDRRTVDDLSIEELEIILAIKKREARQARLKRMAKQGRLVGTPPEDDEQPAPSPRLQELVAEVPAPDHPNTDDTTGERPRWEGDETPPPPARPQQRRKHATKAIRSLRRKNSKKRQRRDQLLLLVEVGSLLLFIGLVIGMAFYVASVVNATNQFNQSAALPTATPAPDIGLAVVLPGGHTSPTSPEGARPNLEEIPEHLRPVMQARMAAPVTVPTPGASAPVRVEIPKINVNHSVVIGDGWEALKLGIGHRIGSANPGERGNMVLSAHNDIFGSIFRYLENLEAGDEVIVHTTTGSYRYMIRESQIVEPTDVWVLSQTQNPTLTLISCYPYMVNTHRIVVFADLV